MEKPLDVPIPNVFSQRLIVFTNALAFVLGFSFVFVVGWGGAATLLGQVFGEYKSILGRVGGVVVILFGLSTIGVVKIPWLYSDTRPQWKHKPKGGLFASGLIGVFLQQVGLLV